jgi:hypothetical protein
VNIRIKYLASASSSAGVRYFWRFDRAVYVPGSLSLRLSDNAILAEAHSTLGDGDGEEKGAKR